MAKDLIKDLIIGAFSNYGYDEVKPWIDSINQCGFIGDKVLITINASEETNQKIRDAGFTVITKTSDGKMMFHMERFLHLFNYLKDKKYDYRYVITTDVRDVVFQSNPSEWLERNIIEDKTMVASSEAIQIKNETWNRENIFKCFGETFYEHIKESPVLCVGTLAGRNKSIRDLCAMLFQLSINRADWVADQAAYNFLMRMYPYNSDTYIANLEDAWAINAHVTNRESQYEEFGPYLLEERPFFEDGLVKDAKTKKPFVIVHQYDRVRAWKKFYEDKFGVKIKSQYTPDIDDSVITLRTDI
jgi:hypothetical protein